VGLIYLSEHARYVRQSAQFAFEKGVPETLPEREKRAGKDQTNMNKGKKLAKQPHPDWAAKGRQCASVGNYTLAIRYFERAVALDSQAASTHLDLGNAYAISGDTVHAISCYSEALRLDPDSEWAWNNLANLFLQLKDIPRAVTCYQNAVRVSPTFAFARYGLGRALNMIGLHQQALEHLLVACNLNPSHADSWLNLGNAHQYLGHFDDALSCFDRALPLSSQPAEVHVNRAIILLNRGNFGDGWREYEFRWKTHGFDVYKKRPLGKPKWRGEPLERKRIFLHAEQGLGDAIQFARFIPEVSARGAEVYLEVDARLKELLAGLLEPGHILARGEPLPTFDYHCSLLSLPFALGVEFGSIPNQPYLSIYQTAREDARRAIEKETDGHSAVRVGIVWRGNPQNRDDLLRSLQPSQLPALAAVKGIKWFLLQNDATSEELTGLPAGFSISTLPPKHLDGFLATGAVIQELDLVVSIDTVTAHLTGALGKPLWLLLPAFYEWRWHSHLQNSPWYPSARLFRQEVPGNWMHPLERLATELTEIARKRREDPAATNRPDG
jgi:tetratricopeptide (TPR) repeat protein